MSMSILKNSGQYINNILHRVKFFNRFSKNYK